MGSGEPVLPRGKRFPYVQQYGNVFRFPAFRQREIIYSSITGARRRRMRDRGEIIQRGRESYLTSSSPPQKGRKSLSLFFGRKYLTKRWYLTPFSPYLRWHAHKYFFTLTRAWGGGGEVASGVNTGFPTTRKGKNAE